MSSISERWIHSHSLDSKNKSKNAALRSEMKGLKDQIEMLEMELSLFKQSKDAGVDLEKSKVEREYREREKRINDQFHNQIKTLEEEV